MSVLPVNLESVVRCCLFYVPVMYQLYVICLLLFMLLIIYQLCVAIILTYLLCISSMFFVCCCQFGLSVCLVSVVCYLYVAVSLTFLSCISCIFFVFCCMFTCLVYVVCYLYIAVCFTFLEHFSCASELLVSRNYDACSFFILIGDRLSVALHNASYMLSLLKCNLSYYISVFYISIYL